ncbi:RING finger protein 10-like [Biomphalaria glabrata]|uniref:E3 ubiquitin-protein ligase RNF10 n=1 Tax=Biomphalaria glabrata TaxID=6526 RepID=A0A9W2YHD6_BIOGL|nr:RING finger protein 10-like [Biomphalaria glabrata]
MLEEGSGTMEKKLPSRQSPVQHKNNGSICEKKSDFVSNKNGRQRKQRELTNACRPQELSQVSRSSQKTNRYFSDKRPRQRDYINDRQSEEIVEAGEIFDVSNTSSRKGNANHLLKFSYISHSQNGNYGGWRSGSARYNSGRGQGYYRRTPAARYSKEQFLQASCQFVVRDDSEYTVQAIDPDALVDWDKVELVRTFSTETVTCPICLQAPFAGKITKCGHTYCWACILHHLSDTDSGGHNKCPVCPHNISASELKSVQCIEVPEYKVGDEIEMRLMQKSKGSVYTCPKSEWKDRSGLPHNIDDGAITNYMKILLATHDQVHQVITKEKESLYAHLLTAEDYEICFIEMAKTMLQEREKKVVASSVKTEVQVESEMTNSTEEVMQSLTDRNHLPARTDTCPNIKYLDAFENEEQTSSDNVNVEAFTATATNMTEVLDSPDLEAKLLPPRDNQDGLALSPEEAAVELELPEGNSDSMNMRSSYSHHSKDTYYFYQASTGQQIYLNSLNAQCLIKEYGSLENGPEVIKATIVAIERIFMTEDIRKRLRYLSHIPLTCEFHVVELKLMPPILSKETLRHFHPEFEKRRRARQKKQKEDKMRAKQQDVEHKKTFGIYPEVEIPLDNLTQFPSHLTASVTSNTSSDGTEENLTPAQASQAPQSHVASNVWGNRSRTDSEGSHSGAGVMTFATMLKEGKSLPPSSPWSRGKPTATAVPASPSRRDPVSPASAEDDECGEFLPAPPISSSWFDDISKAMDAASQQSSAGLDASPKANGKKKKKKQLLFSTSMARKN